MMRAGTLFSGIGAPECAAPDIDWRWAAEIDPFASAVHAARFPGTPNLGNVLEIDWHAVEPVDLVVGGPPCQDYSVAGQRASLSGARGDLTLQYARILDAIDPAWSVAENVPGWLSTPDNAFGTFLGILAGHDAPLVPARGQRWTDAGVVAGPKRTIAWAIKDAQHFGVPQRRRRVFVVACRGAGNWACAAALFPVGEGVRRDTETGRAAGEDIADSITRSFAKHHGASAGKDSILRNAVIAHSLRADGIAAPLGAKWRGDLDNDTYAVGAICAENGSRLGQKAASGHLIAFQANAGCDFDASEDGTGRGTPLIAVGAVAFHQNVRSEVRLTEVMGALNTGGGKPGQGYPAIAFKTDQDPEAHGDICPTLQKPSPSGGGQPTAVMSAMSVRRLTPIECERLQGFPDGWTDVPYRGKPAADGPRYRAVGNSMAVPVIGWVLQRVQQIAAASLEEAA